VITGVGWYHEADCCGYPDVAIVYGYECLYYATGDYDCRDFIAGFYDGGAGTRHDFFRWGDQGQEMTEYWTGKGSLTVNLGP
jgi:hypothetical protein